MLSTEPRRLRARAGRWIERHEDVPRARRGLGALFADGAPDLGMGLRGLATRPLVTGAALLVLGLGIAAAAAIFTLV